MLNTVETRGMRAGSRARRSDSNRRPNDGRWCSRASRKVVRTERSSSVKGCSDATDKRTGSSEMQWPTRWFCPVRA